MSEKTESTRSAWEKIRRKDSVRMRGSNLVKYPFENKLYGFNTKESYDYETIDGEPEVFTFDDEVTVDE